MTVLKHLRQILTEAREPTATYAEVAARFGKGENVVRKFERGETAPRYDDLDRFVESYADLARVSVFDLWDEALHRAREEGKGTTRRRAGAEPDPEKVRRVLGEQVRRAQRPGGSSRAKGNRPTGG